MTIGPCFLFVSYVKEATRYKTEKIQNNYHIMRHHRNHYRGIEVGSTFHQRARRYVVNADSGESFESAKPQHFPKTFLGSIKYCLDVFTKAIVAAALMTCYVTGFNHLTDVEIDKINKPYRPLASGEYSFETGVILTAACLILSFGIGWIVGSPPLMWALSIHFLLGTAYSIDLPLLRWKRIAALAAMCMVVGRGITFQVAYFLHMQVTYVFQRPTMLPRSLIFATAFFSFFSLVLALFKDIPDHEGDEKYGIQSLSVHLGQKKVFWICVSLLEMIYGVVILVGATSSNHWSRMITVSTHGVLASVLWYRSKSVDVKSSSATESFYMFLWKVTINPYKFFSF
ncbi:hypothetical protein V8G54_011960 [Vigna mungo]|uniref:Homogentisate phytyltransferase 1, chloroplastic n=1 Tax=Vigna mungo TaxID=3915 RepID=A0AAQ3S046_VIGMU